MRGFLKSGVIKITQGKPIHYQIVEVKERINDVKQCLLVYKSGFLAGYLYVTENNYCFFYDLNYLAEPNVEAIFPLFPLKIKVFMSEILFPAFSQILPEGHGRQLLEAKMRTADDFSLLAELHHNYGDLTFSAYAKPQTKPTKITSPIHHSWYTPEVKKAILGEHYFPNILDLPIDIDASILFPTATTPSLASQKYVPSGLSGFQHKLSIMLINGCIRQAKPTESSEYFIKPYHKDRANMESQFYFPHLALNEHLFMSFAKNELHFDVPWSAVVKGKTDQEYHYVVKRYDRYNMVKLAHTEFASLLGLESATKYDISTEQMCKVIKRYLSECDERLILLKYLFYSVLICHEDMHTKNLSMMMEGDTNRMAPLYDIACTGIYQNAFGYETHLTIGGQRTQIRPKHFYHLATLLKVQKQKFRCVAKEILDKYTRCLPLYLKKLQVFQDTVIVLKTPANMSGQSQRIKGTDTLQAALTEMHKNRIDSLIRTGWYHELNLPAFQLATANDIASLKREEKIIDKLKLYQFCTKEVVELLVNLKMYRAKAIAEERMKPELS